MSQQNPDPGARSKCTSAATALAVAFVITVAARTIPAWDVLARVWDRQPGGDTNLFQDLVLLTVGASLALSAPRQSGLRIGAIRDHWRGVVIVCGVPVVLTAVIYPRLAEHPFTGAPWSMWLVSPLAQDLVFIGFLHGQFERVFPGAVHPRIPMARALPVTALFFGLWHVPNLCSMSAGYVAFQLAYTMGGLLLTGLSRQWTGSIVYCTLSHSAVNLIASLA